MRGRSANFDRVCYIGLRLQLAFVNLALCPSAPCGIVLEAKKTHYQNALNWQPCLCSYQNCFSFVQKAMDVASPLPTSTLIFDSSSSAREAKGNNLQRGGPMCVTGTVSSLETFHALFLLSSLLCAAGRRCAASVLVLQHTDQLAS